MSLTRRQFMWRTAASTVGSLAWPKPGESGWSVLRDAQGGNGQAPTLFHHGVASGDPLTDRVILWTRLSPGDGGAPNGLDVDWRIATDPAVEDVVARGIVRTTAERDFCVKVDATGLQSGRTYHYVFESGGERSQIGRTKTLPAGGATRVRLASMCCSNYPSGFFNVYRCVAKRDDLDAIVHVGDYIYEFENGRYGDGQGCYAFRSPGAKPSR